jgi:sec-independent protein translocase protein TatB
MFDIGFSEVLLIFVIALVVLGPEKLPRAASQVGRWIGRARAMARQFKDQLEEEVNLENVRKAHKEAAAKEEKSAAASTASSAQGSAEVGAGNATSGADATSAAGSASGASASKPGAQAHVETPVATTIPPEAYTGPDPTEFRADTFSHAHPTNEYGANPLTPNGAPEELKTPAASETSEAHASGAAPGYESGGANQSGGLSLREPVAATATQSDNHGHS